MVKKVLRAVFLLFNLGLITNAKDATIIMNADGTDLEGWLEHNHLLKNNMKFIVVTWLYSFS